MSEQNPGSGPPPAEPPTKPPLPPRQVIITVTGPQGDATGGLIPYKNVPALVAYYLGVFSVVPVIGSPLGLTAVVLGILGLRKAALQPEVKGKAHALVGIIVGGIFGIGYTALISFAVVSIVADEAMF